MAKNFKKQIAERNKQSGQQPAVPGVQENLIQREPIAINQPVNDRHSLLSDIARPELKASGQIVRVRVSEVYTTDQVRPEEDFEEAYIEGLTGSFEEVGILSPPRAFPRDKRGYRIWLGENRLRSALSRGDEFIELYVGEAPADERKRILGQLIENLHQSGLKPLATANNIFKLKTEWNMTGEQIAKSLGKPTSFVSKHMRLIDAPESITSLLRDKVTADLDLVYTLCQINDAAPEEAERLVKIARKDKLSRSQAKSALDVIRNRGWDKGTNKKGKQVVAPEEPTHTEPETVSESVSNTDQKEARIMVSLGQESGYILLKLAEQADHVWVRFPSEERCVEAIKLIVRGVMKA